MMWVTAGMCREITPGNQGFGDSVGLQCVVKVRRHLVTVNECQSHVHRVRGKRDRQRFGNNFNKFERMNIIFDNRHHEGGAKLTMSLMPTSPNQCSYFTL